MRTYQGKEKVKSGYYLRFHDKEIIEIINENEELPGVENDRYLKIPLLGMIVGGPILGLLYVIFLPFISFAMVLTVLGKALWARLQVAGTKLVHVTATSWSPAVAYFAWWRHPRTKETPETKHSTEPVHQRTPDVLDELEKEIADRRKELQ